ncbi:12768_t:CDS:2, partial [Funneliformis geosporum]
LSLINAFPHQLQKKTTSFVRCPPPKGSNTSPHLLPVIPGKPDTLTVFGTLDSDITAMSRPVCKDAGCPIQAKSSFSTNVDIPTPISLTTF